MKNNRILKRLKKISNIENFNKEQMQIYETLINNGYNQNDAEYLIKNELYFISPNNNDETIGHEFVNYYDGVKNLSNNTLNEYFDYESFGHDMNDEIYNILKYNDKYVCLLM